MDCHSTHQTGAHVSSPRNFVGDIFNDCSVTLRVVTLPSTGFDGNRSVTFVADGIGMNSSSIRKSPIGGNALIYANDDEYKFDKTNTYYNQGSTAQQAKITSGASSESQDSNDFALPVDTSGPGSNISSSSVTFNVTFYHCDTSHVWNPNSSRLDSISDGSVSEGCQLCSDTVEGETEVGHYVTGFTNSQPVPFSRSRSNSKVLSPKRGVRFVGVALGVYYGSRST